MSFFIVAALAVGTGIQVYGQLESGKDQEAALKTQAEEERVAAESRELDRQQKLNKALAANAVGMGISGIKAEGTPASIALQSAKDIGLSEGTLKLSDRLAQAQLRRQASNVSSASQLAAAGTLLSGATKIYGAYNTPTPTTTTPPGN